MDIGEMTERVTIRQPGTVKDSHGAIAGGGATTIATVWAKVQMLSGTELLRAEAVASSLRCLVTAYYRADVIAKMHLLWTPTRLSSSTQRTLEILAVRPANDPLFMELDCGELG